MTPELKRKVLACAGAVPGAMTSSAPPTPLAGLAGEEVATFGLNEHYGKCPEGLRLIAAENSRQMDGMITKKASCSTGPIPIEG